METYPEMAQVLNLADKNARAAILNMTKDLKKNDQRTLIKEIGNLSRYTETKKGSWNSMTEKYGSLNENFIVQNRLEMAEVSVNLRHQLEYSLKKKWEKKQDLWCFEVAFGQKE